MGGCLGVEFAFAKSYSDEDFGLVKEITLCWNGFRLDVSQRLRMRPLAESILIERETEMSY